MKRLLIANRNEIAVRVIRAAREMGIEAVLAVSDADRETLAARLADDVVVIGPPPATKSYLNRRALLDAAVRADVDAVHPGYGFLSEDATFARSVLDAGLIWVGPDPESIDLMGNKAAAREAARAAGVPVTRGSDGIVRSRQHLREVTEALGYPVVIKASAGGGGRGIRIVRTAESLESEYQLATAEAGSAFGDPSVYVERFIERARHIEVQVLGDGVDVVHLYDRDCSLQRRQQKIVEEAPATALPREVRKQMLASAVQLAKQCRYRGAGTVEFLFDPDTCEISFIEMNTRLQVEHPATEMITGLDLVREQLRIAEGEKIGIDQSEIPMTGHAIEIRLNAEDPACSFLPSPGAIEAVHWPGGPGVRIDAGVRAGSTVSPYYDSLLAKLIVWHESRELAIERARRALAELEIVGVETTAGFIRELLDRAEFRGFDHHTKFIEQDVL